MEQKASACIEEILGIKCKIISKSDTFHAIHFESPPTPDMYQKYMEIFTVFGLSLKTCPSRYLSDTSNQTLAHSSNTIILCNTLTL